MRAALSLTVRQRWSARRANPFNQFAATERTRQSMHHDMGCKARVAAPFPAPAQTKPGNSTPPGVHVCALGRPIHRKNAMTPRDQIQQHAKAAAEKVRAAMAEFSKATGMRASVDVNWVQASFISSDTPVNLVESVRLRICDEAHG